MLWLYQGPDDPASGEDFPPEGSFRFHCRPGLSCFNRCCREAALILSPFDLLRLSRSLGVTTGEFLRRYTRRESEACSRLPLVLVKPARTGGCPFLGEAGCTVYADRPAACRLFPLTQGSEWQPQGVVDYYFLRRLDYCQGFEGKQEWTLETWQAGQGFAAFDRPRRAWLELLLKQGQPGRTPPDDRLLTQFSLMAYDLDGFRTFLFESAFLRRHGLSPETAASLRPDDLALLRFSAACLATLLFPEDSTSLQEALQEMGEGDHGFSLP